MLAYRNLDVYGGKLLLLALSQLSCPFLFGTQPTLHPFTLMESTSYSEDELVIHSIVAAAGGTTIINQGYDGGKHGK